MHTRSERRSLKERAKSKNLENRVALILTLNLLAPTTVGARINP